MRVVAAVEQGELSISEVVSLFNVGRTFVKKMLRLHRNGDDMAPRHGGGPVPSIQEAEQVFLREQIAKQPDASLEELKTALLDQQQISVSKATVSRALLALNLPRKKRVFSPRSVTKSGETSSAA